MENMQVNIIQKAELVSEGYAKNYEPVVGVFPTLDMAEKFIKSVPFGDVWLSIGSDDVTGDYLVFGDVLEVGNHERIVN